MPQLGLLLLAMVAVITAASGQPVFVVLIFASVVGAAVAVAGGSVPLALLGALPGRMIGLLEHDLLQAVPLFVLVGALLNRLPLAELLYRSGCRLSPRSAAAQRVSAVGLSALLAPMNGSVGASVAMLSRVVAPRLLERGTAPAETTALVIVSSTLGVLVPPSIVLLLLGDAMMRAHTEALSRTGLGTRILNTQDLLHGVIPPAALMLVLVGCVAAWQARHVAVARGSSDALTWRERAVVLVTVSTLLALLGGVALGLFYAVEAAATGGVLLLIGAGVTGQLTAVRLKAALHDALDITGSLFALFVAATTFTLVLRLLGTDRWVEALFAQLPGGAGVAVATALAVMLLSALVLDAFELIFVVVPILMPPVLMRVDDALWVAVLSLLALQISFALPPLGYAVMMTGARITPQSSLRALMRALAPYLLALASVLVLVLARPGSVHLLDAQPAAAVPALSPQEVERLLRGEPAEVQP